MQHWRNGGSAYLGTHNRDAGPDFLSANIRIGDTLWVGNVEIHVKSSQWTQHKHQHDKAYDNVVLHVVQHHDQPVFRANGEPIPTLAITYPTSLQERFQELINTSNPILCHASVAQFDKFRMRHWLVRLATERLERKSGDIRALLQATTNNWDTTFYRFLFRYLGFKVNAVPFEMLAQQLPSLLLKKHQHSLHSLEALLLGQAGLLQSPPTDDYQESLWQEYNHLRHKYDLTPMNAELWKFARLRPSNFPSLRIAQLASLLTKVGDLFEAVMMPNTAKGYIQLLDTHASTYWNTHYSFGKPSSVSSIKRLGSMSAELIVANVIVPILFEYGRYKADGDMQERALNLLEELTPERNTIIHDWEQVGVMAENAFESQALLQLRSNYCDKKMCLHCPVGKQLIEDKIK